MVVFPTITSSSTASSGIPASATSPASSASISRQMLRRSSPAAPRLPPGFWTEHPRRMPVGDLPRMRRQSIPLCKVIKRCSERGGTDIHGSAAALFPGMPPYLGCTLSVVHRRAISLTRDGSCRLTGIFPIRCIRRDQHINLLLPAYGKLQAACLCPAHFTRHAHATASFFRCEQPPLIAVGCGASDTKRTRHLPQVPFPPQGAST